MSGKSALAPTQADFGNSSVSKESAHQSPWMAIKWILSPLASLRLTVVLFLFSILLIFVGTLAQCEWNMWKVIDRCFRAWVAVIPIRMLFPSALFPRLAWKPPGSFILPGGSTLGFALALNLVAAHLVRFKVQSRGPRLLAGLLVMLLGIGVTAVVIMGGDSSDGLQAMPQISWDALWWLIVGAISVAGLGCVVLLTWMDRSRKIEIAALIGGTLLFGTFMTVLLARGIDHRISDPSMRILWQLIQGLVAGTILLIGATMTFKKRGGIVVIHLGVGLLMISELIVGMYAHEQNMTIAEGETVNFARDSRHVELAIIDRSPEAHDNVTAVPNALLKRSAKKQTTIESELLPFEIQVEEYLPNCRLATVGDDDEIHATDGVGLTYRAIKTDSAGGAQANGKLDIAGMYATIWTKDNPDKPQTRLFAQQFGDADVLTESGMAPIAEKIQVGEKTYDVYLRFQRDYKPYEVTLKDVRATNYIGTTTAKDYSSYLAINDEQRDFFKDDVRIWMNNPLRYGGETFYQQNYTRRPDGTEVTTLQVVANRSWMIPYVACMLCLVGMLFHFAQTLYRFLDRQVRQAHPAAVEAASATPGTPGTPDARSRQSGQNKFPLPLTTPSVLVPVLTVLVTLVYIGIKTRAHTPQYQAMDLDQFAEIPVVYGGRVKPIDTLARNFLRTVSDKQVLRVPKTPGDWKKTEKQDALVWLLDTITQTDAGWDHRVFRVENPSVRTTLALEKRKRFRYSLEEITKKYKPFLEEVNEARAVAAEDTNQLNYYQRKVLETANRIQAFQQLKSSFQPIPFPAMPTEEERKSNPEAARKTIQTIAERMMSIPRLNEELVASQPPLTVPPPKDAEDATWLPYAAAANDAFLQRTMGNGSVTPYVIDWIKIIDAYARKDARTFNRAVRDYLREVRRNPPPEYDAKKIAFEHRFNNFQPFLLGMYLYVAVGLFTVLGWLIWFEPFRRTGVALLVITIFVHTLALLARMYISGRPPVTNLYSSAVFIGWGGAIAGLIIEAFLRNGFGNVLSSVLGFSTLFIAHQLAFGGDTFTVLVAVLDTQFWLATHVLCITLGYMTTFVAGLLAIMYLLAAIVSRQFTTKDLKDVSKAVYGSLCFAIFFSFIGTVLGGLWADDSWGRFWGWDPKENGALMIVLWNALILHARWGKMVRDRGAAVLAVFGNIVTAWSWFGVNELNVGLHSYGFTEGVLPALLAFAILMLGFIVLGCVPESKWRRNRSPAEQVTS